MTPPKPYKEIGKFFGRTDLACRLHINQLRRRRKTGVTSPPARRISAYENWLTLKLYQPPPPVSQDEAMAAAQSLQQLSLAASERENPMAIKNLINKE